MDLHAVQNSATTGISLANPHNSLLRTYLRSLRLNESRRIKSSYQDRGAGTLHGGYTTPEKLIRIPMYYFTAANEADLRNRLVFLMQNNIRCF